MSREFKPPKPRPEPKSRFAFSDDVTVSNADLKHDNGRNFVEAALKQYHRKLEYLMRDAVTKHIGRSDWTFGDLVGRCKMLHRDGVCTFTIDDVAVLRFKEPTAEAEFPANFINIELKVIPLEAGA